MKKIVAFIMVFMMALILVACGETTITIKYETNGGNTINSEKIDLDDLTSLNLPTPTKEGYEFAGWYFDSEFSKEFKASDVKKDITLYAKWIEITKKLTVKFVNDEEENIVLVEKGQKVAEPTAPTKKGYTFLGWYDVESEYDFNAEVTENITLYALWQESITNLSIDESSLKLENNLLSVDISVFGYDITSLSVSDVTIEGLTVDAVSINNNIINLLIKTNAKTLDEAVEELDQKNIIFKASAFKTDENVSLLANFNKASFSFSCPKFNENEDGSIDMTLYLKVSNGTFASDFAMTNVLLDGDIYRGCVEKIEINGNIAEVKVNIPAEITEKFEEGFDALVYLVENSLVNNWGTKVEEISSFYQIIEPSFPLGATPDEVFTTMNDFSVYVGSSNITKALGPYSGVVSLVTGIFTTTYDICKLCGFVSVDKGPSEFEQLCAKFDAVYDHLSLQDEKLKEILKILEEAELEKIRDTVSSFTTIINDLELSSTSLASYIKVAANDEDLMNGVKVPTSSIEEISKKLLEAREKGVSEDKLLDTLSTNELKIYKEWKDYYASLINNIETKAKSTQIYGNKYAGYYSAIDEVKNKFKSLCNTIISTDDSIFSKYDYLCTKVYLFDLTAIPARMAYRASARAALDYAISLLMKVYGGFDIDMLKDSVAFMSLYDNYYCKAVKVIEESQSKVKRVAPEELPNVACFYAAGSKAINFGLLKFDYDPTKSYSEHNKNAKIFYETIRKRLYWFTVKNDVLKEVEIRLRNIGYSFKDGTSNELMYTQARVMADTLGYPTEPSSKGYINYYLESFDYVETTWERDKEEDRMYLIVILHNCVMYDIITGEKYVYPTYAYSQDYDYTSRIYVIYK